MYLHVSYQNLLMYQKYGVIYGGVQKNDVGPAGVVIAIIREDLIPGRS